MNQTHESLESINDSLRVWTIAYPYRIETDLYKLFRL